MLMIVVLWGVCLNYFLYVIWLYSVGVFLLISFANMEIATYVTIGKLIGFACGDGVEDRIIGSCYRIYYRTTGAPFTNME